MIHIRSVGNIGQLVDAARLGTTEELNVVKVSFGKYKGKMISEVPKPYIKWAEKKLLEMENDR